MAKKAFFMKRLNDHVQYLKEIDATLKGTGTFQGTSHCECALGKWMYGEGIAEVQALGNDTAKTIFDSLQEPHEQFHVVSKQALEKKQAGDEEGAKAALTEMHVLSTAITNKLLQLDGLS